MQNPLQHKNVSKQSAEMLVEVATVVKEYPSVH